MVTSAVEREAVTHLQIAFGMSERRACKIIACCRMTMRYQTRRTAQSAADRSVAANTEIIIGTTREEMASFYVDDAALEAVAQDVLKASVERRYADSATETLQKIAAFRVPAAP